MKLTVRREHSRATIRHPFGEDRVGVMAGFSGKRWFFGLLTVKPLPAPPTDPSLTEEKGDHA